MFAASHRIGVDAEEAKETGGGEADALKQQFAVAPERRRRSGEGRQDRDRNACGGAWGVDGEVGGVAEPPQPLAVLAP